MSGFPGQTGPLPGVFLLLLVQWVGGGGVLNKNWHFDLCQDFLGRSDPYLEVFFVAIFLVCFWLNKN